MSAYYTQIARFYDAETNTRTDDLALYSQLAEQYGGPIFDVGCGTGRVMLHLAQEGYKVHGVDANRAMLDRLDRKLKAFPRLAKNITYHEGDILAYEDEMRYPLMLLTYNALMHFHDQDVQIALLEKLHSLMTPDGLLVIDLPNAGETFATEDNDHLIVDRTFLDPETGHMIMLQTLSQLDRTTQLLHVEWIYDEITEDGTVKRLFAPHVLRYYFFPEMKLLLERTGFEVEAVYGDTLESPFDDGCERMVIYATPAGD
ncbi:class I SAM-dependent methyltransferase [Phototrophicus methaneseepsis]|uniref:Class I SAM-dependent methyltransferase n=1 Tax=Phototrophicus methaneseepsis TaxID=2710758 RepID=A0A7S8E8D2_9CHLR|nr:class I SAM-dependent methyltransferase [Phototrophicus methaneseepsis]QPC82148.1 class I SAM-dependent methyltransferase [Phototrophicus methaneseepsis]